MYVIQPRRGGVVGINYYTSRKDAERMITVVWKISLDDYEIINLFEMPSSRIDEIVEKEIA